MFGVLMVVVAGVHELDGGAFGEVLEPARRVLVVNLFDDPGLLFLLRLLDDLDPGVVARRRRALEVLERRRRRRRRCRCRRCCRSHGRC